MKEQAKYFLGSIFEAKSAYNIWKMIVYSKYIHYVGEEMANKYVEIQKTHANFFKLVERSLLFHWVLVILHCFDDHRKDTYSLNKMDKKHYNEFLKNKDNRTTLKRLKDVRNSLLAHRAKIIKNSNLGSVEELDLFFKNVENLYNNIRHDLDSTGVLFNNADDIKFDVESLFMNIEIANNITKQETEDELLWWKNQKRISNIL
ncbi:MAG: hypothetical protein AAB837_02415 [Patescibacteria group bacterium]